MDIEKFKKDYATHEINRKKLMALKNYGLTMDDFEEWCIMELVVRYMETKFLDDTHQRILDTMLERHNIKYLDWCHKPQKHESDKPYAYHKNEYMFVFPDLDERKISEWNERYATLKVMPSKLLNMETGKWMR